MFYAQQRNRASTLIELLIVLAVIGILATMVLSAVVSSRDSAQRVKTLASLWSAQNVASICVERGANLSVPNIAIAICATQNNWPAPVGNGWMYGDAGVCTFDGDVSDGTFMFCASDGTKVISCTDRGCTVN